MTETYDLFQKGREQLRSGMPAQATVSLEKARRREPRSRTRDGTGRPRRTSSWRARSARARSTSISL
jgi:hypothetical protein